MVLNHQKVNCKSESNEARLPYKKELESRRRVWENLEKILDQQEQNVTMGKVDYQVMDRYGRANSYFSWDIA